MEIGISDADAKYLGLTQGGREKIVGLVHRHIGSVSAVSVKIVEEPDGVQLETGFGTIVVDRDLTRCVLS